jgi:MFS family permease
MRPWAAQSALPVTLLVQAAASAATIAPAVAAPRLLAELGLGPAAVGVYIALVYLGAMFSSQWGAAAVARAGPIFTSQVALVACGTGVLLVAVPNLYVAAVGALLIGAGYGPITPASSAMLARTTPPHRYALVFSIKQTGVPLGGALAGLTIPTALAHVGPMAALGQLSALCLLGLALAEVIRRDLDLDRNPAAAAPDLASLLRPIRFVLGHPVLRKLALCSMVFSAVQVCLTSYIVSFLSTDLHWSLVAAGVGSAVAQGAGVVGRVIWGIAADRLRDARVVLLGLAWAMALCGLVLGLSGTGTGSWAILALLVVYGATAIGWNGVFLATAASLVPLPQAATATSGCLFFTYFGVVVGPPLFGAAAWGYGSLGVGYVLLAIPLAATLWSLHRADWTR